MQTFKQIITVPESHEITVRIPDEIQTNETAEVHLIFQSRISQDARIADLREAMRDPLFLADLEESLGRPLTARTLDESLEEIDRWKQKASEETRGMSVEERLAKGREDRAWLETKLGRKLPEITRTKESE